MDVVQEDATSTGRHVDDGSADDWITDHGYCLSLLPNGFVQQGLDEGQDVAALTR